jgi:hypothetical protein
MAWPAEYPTSSITLPEIAYTKMTARLPDGNADVLSGCLLMAHYGHPGVINIAHFLAVSLRSIFNKQKLIDNFL